MNPLPMQGRALTGSGSPSGQRLNWATYLFKAMAYRQSMPSFIASLLAIIVVAVSALVAIVVAGIRFKWPPVIDRVRHMNRSYFASQQLETAGGAGAYAGVLHHRGRHSGASHATPVGIKRHGGDFVIAIVYGSHTQWVKNVMAFGSAIIDLEGETYQVECPEIVPMATVADAFSAGDQRLNRLLAIDECLLLRPVAATAS